MRHRRALAITGLAVALTSLAVYGLVGHRVISSLYRSSWFGAIWTLTAWGSAKPLAFCYRIADAVALLFAGTVAAGAGVTALGAQRLYLYSRRAASALLRDKAKTAAIGGLGSLLVLSAIALLVLQSFPNSADEYCYLYQAQTLAAGRLYNCPHPLQEFFNSTHIVSKGGKLFSVYPLGWPLLLAGAVLLHLPLWLINPLLGTLSLFVLFRLGRKLYGDNIAILAALLLLVSPYFLFNAASLFAHQLCGLLLLLTYYHGVRLLESGKARDAVMVGFWFGWAFLTRGYTSLLCVLPLVVYVACRKPEALRHLGLVALGVAPWALVFLAYNHAVTGSALLVPQAWAGTNRYWLAPDTLTRGVAIWGSLVIRFLGWTPLFILLTYMLLVLTHARSSKTGTGFVFLALMLGMFFYADSGGNQYGARYYYEAYPFLLVFCVAAVFGDAFFEKRPGLDRLLFGLLAVSMLTVAPLTVYHLVFERRAIAERRDLYAQVADAGIHNGIVFLKTGTGTARPMPAGDLVRNRPGFSDDVLYALDRGDDNKRLMDYYPDRHYYRYTYDVVANRGRIQKIDSPPERTDLQPRAGP